METKTKEEILDFYFMDRDGVNKVFQRGSICIDYLKKEDKFYYTAFGKTNEITLEEVKKYLI